MTVADLAAEAAHHWSGSIVRLIKNRENAVFEMLLPHGRAALRLHRVGYQNTAAIESELWWCTALAASGVAVPAALPTHNGALLARLSTGRAASAIAWVQGEALGQSGIPFSAPLSILLDRHRALGRLIASVHAATDALTLPAAFTRPRWDIDGLVGEVPFWNRFWEHPAADPAQSKVLRDARDVLHHQLTDCLVRGADFGLIHADVLRENVLVSAKTLTLIDFDDSGFGFRLYDLGTALSQNLYEPAYPQIRDALIAGYAETRPADTATVELMILARCCASVGWTMPRLAITDPVIQSHLARAVMWARRVMRQTTTS